MLRKIALTILCIFFITQCLPVTTFADLVLEDYKSEAELRIAIIGDEKWMENFPKGLFNFIGTQFRINENQKFLELAVVRQGGTQGKASVKFKAIDVSAKYGTDYVIRVYENYSKNEIKKNDNSIMLMDTLGDNVSINISDSSKKRTVVDEVYGDLKVEEIEKAQNDVSVDEATADEQANEEVSKDDATVAEEVYKDTYADLPKLDTTFGEGHKNSVSSLREAREKYLGKKSDRPNWRTIDADKVEELKAEYDKFLYSMPGTETTIEFEDGEYIKYLYFIPLNDEFSESEEQVMFALERPEGGASRGEFYMSYVNLIDDEEPETPTFEIEASKPSEDGTASVIVRRNGGIHQYSSVLIGTEEGTAVPGVDYEPGMEELFFTPGMTMQTVSVNVLDNTRRGKDRQFAIALDRTNESVKAESAETVITLPAFSGAPVLFTEEPHNINAEKITPYGYSPEKGKWMLAGKDFEKAGGLAFKNGFQPIVTENGIGFNYTASGTTNEKTAQSVTYDFESLGGVNKIDFYYYNNGGGKSGKYLFQGNVVLRYTNNNILKYEQKYIYGVEGRCNTPEKLESLTLDDSKWTLYSQIALDTYAPNGNHTAPYFSDVTLHLKEYSTSIAEAQKIQKKKYTMNKGVINYADAKVYKEYMPGSLYIKRVDSNVGNYQNSPANPKVYRSDRIEFGYDYSEDNPNGKYAKYTGFEIQNGDKWVYFPGTELILDANFFKKSGIYDAIKGGIITIRPVFEKRGADLRITFYDTGDGYFKNSSDATKTGVKRYVFDEGKLCIGDTIADLEAQVIYASTPPVWESYKGNVDIPSPECINAIDAVANTKINYNLENSNNWLMLTFKSPSVIIKADPSSYKFGIDMLPFKLDGLEYSDRDAFSNAVEDAYEKGKNPKLDIEFKYVFASDYPDTDGKVKNEFGKPHRACLTVYRSDGTVRSIYFADYNTGSGSFKFSQKPVDEGWALDDIATVYIEGIGTTGGLRVHTKEVVIDFLKTYRSGVVVLPPVGEDFREQYSDIKTPVIINDANPLKHYKMQAFTPSGFTAKWTDASPDSNNDGKISVAEHDELEKKLQTLLVNPKIKLEDKGIWTNESYYGNIFSYAPKFFNPSRIYYEFEKLESTGMRDIEFKLSEKYSTALEPDSYSNYLPICGAEVYIGNVKAEDSGNGIYKNRGNYKTGNYYMSQYILGNQVYIFPVSTYDKEIVINTSDLVKPYELKAYIADGSKEKEQSLTDKNGLLDIKNAATRITYRLNGSGAGVSANGSIVRIYDFNGKLHHEERTGPPSNGEFSFALNSYAEGIKAGYTMTIAGLIVNSDGDIIQEYPEVRTGITFCNPLTAIDALASFATPVKPVLEMIGKLNNEYDLGMDVVVGDDAHRTDYTDTKGFNRKARTITFGFNSEDAKDHEKSVKDPEKSIAESVKEEVEKEGVEKKAKEAAKDGKSKKSGGGDFNMEYKISLALTIEYGQIESAKYDGKNYFRSLVIMATATAEYKKERTFITPIGLPVKVTLTAGGDGFGVVAFDGYQEDYKDQYTDKYRLDGSGAVSLKPQNYDIYSKLNIKPKITLAAGTGFDYLDLTVGGGAEFDLSFDFPIVGDAVSSAGSGYVTISAWLKIKMLFYQKKWTLYDSDKINLFKDRVGSDVRFLSALEKPYGSYLYEKADGISDDEILTRDYTANRGEWNTPDNLTGVISDDETVLQKGVFPYPQTKLINIDGSKTLLLFIEDDITRDGRNRASLMYSIIEDGAATPPVALDDNGTWDEAPDAFMVDGRILVVWSDAGKIFDSEDTEYDILHAMDISGIWFDIAAETFGEKFLITKTVEGGDCYSDINPEISYDPDTKRLMVYYTKIDYSDGWEVPLYTPNPETEPILEAPEPLFGDIVNGYNTIAYRYAEYDESKNEFVWNETYSEEEELNSEEFYGQRFLSLAPVAEIVEEEHEIENETVTINGEEVTLKHIGTEQTVEKYKGLADPRIVEMDLSTYDGLAVFAYIMDYSSDIKTPHDQQLYVQIYNYEENKFYYPIQITNNDVQDTKPQFIRFKGTTYLYWLQDGKIVYTDINHLFDEGRLKEVSVLVDGKEKKFRIIDKSNTSKEAHITTALEYKDGIDEYEIISGEDRVYVLWTEDGITYKNGLKPGDEGTEDPRNMNKERQIFAASALWVDGEKLDSFSWSQPIQLTLTEGQSFSDLSFGITGKDEFLGAYARYEQEYDEARGYFISDNSVRTLAVNRFLVTSELELGEVTINKEYPMAGETVDAELKVVNTGLETYENYEYQYYLTCNDEIIYESGWYPKDDEKLEAISGGASASLKGSFIMPDTLEDVESLKIGFDIKDREGNLIGSREKEISVKHELRIKIMERELKDKDSAYLSVYVKNLGNKAFAEDFSLSSGSIALHSEMVRLEPEEDKIVSFEAGLKGTQFGELLVGEDGSRYDVLPLLVKIGEFEESTDIKRQISAGDFDVMQKVQSFNIMRGSQNIQNGAQIAMRENDVMYLGANIIRNEDEASRMLKVTWESSNPDAASVLSSGTLMSRSSGTTTITATLHPDIRKTMAYGDGTFETLDDSYTLPKGALIQKSFVVKVGSTQKDDSEGGSSNTPSKTTVESASQVLDSNGNVMFSVIPSLNTSTGIASANINSDLLAKALQKSNSLGISIPEVKGARSYELILPSKSLSTEKEAYEITLKTALGTITLPSNMIPVNNSGGAQKVSLNIAAADKSKLSKEIQEQIGDRPIIELSLKVDGRQIAWNNPNAPVTVSIPYKPTAEELKDPEHIVARYIDSSGTVVSVPSGRYDAKTGTVVFTTDHFSQYAVAFVYQSFNDLNAVHWAKKPIEVMASKGIINGTGKGNYLPAANITRADYLVMLIRTLGLTADFSDNFEDVKRGTHYYEAVGIAKKLGIATGSGNNRFNPTDVISRQDMMVLAARALKKSRGLKNDSDTITLNKFSDKGDIAQYAVNSIASLIDEELITGHENRINPRGNTTRAEAAVFLYRIYNKY